jgi:hypothetical protein
MPDTRLIVHWAGLTAAYAASVALTAAILWLIVVELAVLFWR